MTNQEELALLRRIVKGLLNGGRLTAEDSYENDYCWDLAEEWLSGKV